MIATPAHQLAAESVLAGRDAIAERLVEREFARHPELVDRYGATGRAKSLQDARYHLSFLAQALAVSSPALFADYVAWVKVMLGQRNVRASDLVFHLECLGAVLQEELPPESGALAAQFITTAVDALPAMPDDMPTFLHAGEPLTPLAHQYLATLRRGERHIASRLILDAVAAGTPVEDIYLHVFQPAQHEIGRLWQTNRISVAQEHYCSAATQLIMSQLYSHIFATAKNGRTLVATCVAGDLHEIGIRMVADFFELAGWSTYYLGANTPNTGVIASIVEHKAQVIAISATISYHVEAVRALVSEVRQHAVARHVSILVGGYPFIQDPALWKHVGADGSARDAREAVTLANGMATSAAP